jgi:Pyridoxamine 5'-phosphate oxidase
MSDAEDTTGVAGTVSFGEMEAEAPVLAQRARERFGATGLSLVGTLRSDGWPRISPVEPLILDGRLYLGMMPGSTKSRDLQRDPRCLVHSTIADKDGTEGEVKLYGRARHILDDDEFERYCVALEQAIGWRPQGGPTSADLWLVGLVRGAYVRFDGTHQHVATWAPGSPMEERSRIPPS